MKKYMLLIVCIIAICGCEKKEENFDFSNVDVALKCNINLDENEVYDYMYITCKNNEITSANEYMLSNFDSYEEAKFYYDNWIALNYVLDIECDISNYTSVSCINKFKINRTCSDYKNYFESEKALGKCEIIKN